MSIMAGQRATNSTLADELHMVFTSIFFFYDEKEFLLIVFESQGHGLNLHNLHMMFS